MKELRQVPGNRKWKGDDWLGMQQNLLQLTEGFYAQYGNFVLSGCVVSGSNISAGIVLLDGKACPFAGATGVSGAYYVKKVTTAINVEYETGTGDGYESYTAEPCAATDAGAFRLDGARRWDAAFVPKVAGSSVIMSSDPDIFALAESQENGTIKDYCMWGPDIPYYSEYIWNVTIRKVFADYIFVEARGLMYGGTLKIQCVQGAWSDWQGGTTYWTPVYVLRGFDVSVSSGLRFQRIGNRVFVDGIFTTTATGTGGVLKIKGLPKIPCYGTQQSVDMGVWQVVPNGADSPFLVFTKTKAGAGSIFLNLSYDIDTDSVY